MARSLACRSINLFVFLLILDGTAIFFFTRGFLLTRTELSMFSNCSDIAQCPSSCFEHPLPNLNSEQVVTKVSNTGNSYEGPNLESRLGDRELEESATSDDLNDKQCWTKPAIKKAVILIIDALRFDFVAHSRNFAGERKPWMDKLHVLQHNVEKENKTAQMFKFIADPPTTTLQRLKGLTTGGLPTFIDIGNSFGAPAIVEDNLIFQLARIGKKVIMMGDDTWMQLFPTQFAEAYPFPSFNVKDLHTVDDGVIRELFPALQRDDWDVLIGHFLGVDHVGHIFGVESPLMPEKLEQYNKVIEDVIELLRNSSEPGGLFEDTVLIVMGDHGQTLNGDHGGGTPEEVETALFVLGTHGAPSSLLPNTFRSSCDLVIADSKKCSTQDTSTSYLWIALKDHVKVEVLMHCPMSEILFEVVSRVSKEDPVSGCINTFSQLDFPVTLAALLGVPFPFGSVGHVNEDVYTLVAGKALLVAEHPHDKGDPFFFLKLMDRYKEVLCVNSWQVRRYLEVYSEFAITGFPKRDLVRLEDHYTKAQTLSDGIKGLEQLWMSAEDQQAREDVILGAILAVREQINAYEEYLSALAALARSQWTQFGIEWMVVGLSILMACIFVRAVALYQLYHSSSTDLDRLFPSTTILLGSLLCLGLTVTVVYPLSMLLQLIVVTVAAFWGAYYYTRAEGMSREKTVKNSNNDHQKVGSRWGGSGHLIDFRTMATSLLVTLHLISLFSNSYIVAEGLVMYFLISSSGFLYLRSSVQAQSKLLQAVSFLAIIWIMPKIHSLAIFKGVVAGGSQGVSKELLSGSVRQILLTCSTIIVPLGILSWLSILRSTKNLAWRIATAGATAMYCLIGLHWLVADLSSGEIVSVSDTLIEFTRLQVPRLVYGMSILLILTAGIVGTYCSRGINEIDTNYRCLVGVESTSLLAGASGPVVLLMGRKGPLLALLIVLEVWLFLELQSETTSSERMKIRANDNPEPGRETKMKSSFRATVDWSLIAAQIFFCTGHSCAFDGLHYSAAYIGFDDFGFFQQGVLLATETFGASHFLPVMGLPILALGLFGSPPRQNMDEGPVILEITKGYLWFGLLKALVTSITTGSVGIQRRHLMVKQLVGLFLSQIIALVPVMALCRLSWFSWVWGIFAPKYVFDAVGFLLVDVFIILSASVYFSLQRRKVQ